MTSHDAKKVWMGFAFGFQIFLLPFAFIGLVLMLLIPTTQPQYISILHLFCTLSFIVLVIHGYFQRRKNTDARFRLKSISLPFIPIVLWWVGLFLLR